MSQAELILDMPPIRSEQPISTSLAGLDRGARESTRRPSAGVRHSARPHSRISGRSDSSRTTAASPRGSLRRLCAARSRPDRLRVHPRLVESPGPNPCVFDLGSAADYAQIAMVLPMSLDSKSGTNAATHSRFSGRDRALDRAGSRNSRGRRGSSRDRSRICAAGRQPRGLVA